MMIPDFMKKANDGGLNVIQSSLEWTCAMLSPGKATQDRSFHVCEPKQEESDGVMPILDNLMKLKIPIFQTPTSLAWASSSGSETSGKVSRTWMKLNAALVCILQFALEGYAYSRAYYY
ncbi:hypothetical protein L1887_05195 [Cichorium endivia]|nr:hypothetical protein L1887_05195 [Cichorium endivia]